MYVHSPLSKKRVDSNLRRAPNRRKSTNGNRFNQHDFSTKQFEAKKSRWTSIKPWKVIWLFIGLGLIGTLYLTHVFKTQQILREVQHLEAEYKKVKRVYHEKKLKHDRLTGPTVIYPRAKELGFINGIPSENILEVKR